MITVMTWIMLVSSAILGLAGVVTTITEKTTIDRLSSLTSALVYIGMIYVCVYDLFFR